VQGLSVERASWPPQLAPLVSKWVDTLQTLTGSGNLHYLTMLTWRKIFALNRLLRLSKAWCPLCYVEWRKAHQVVYEPLLWTLNGVDLCLRHQQPLVTICPNCQTSVPILKQTSRPGHCSRCARWLGELPTEERNQPNSSNAEEHKQQLWKVEVVGELLAAAPSLTQLPAATQISTMLKYCLDQYAHGNVTILARLLGEGMSTIWNYLWKGQTPFFNSLLCLCANLEIRPLEFLTTSPFESIKPSWFALDHLPVISRGKRKRVMPEDVERMRQAIGLALVEGVDPPPSPQMVAERLGFSVKTLKRYCPDQYQAISARYQNRGFSDDELSQMQRVLEDSLASKESLPLWVIVKRTGYTDSTVRKYFPGLCQAIVMRYRGRFNDAWMCEQLQKVLASKELTPSVRMLAMQMGCNPETLRLKFPELCRKISDRRRREQRKQHEENIALLRVEVSRAVLTLYKQGVYPSTEKVARLLSKPSNILCTYAQETWREEVEKLGYK
jgi:hypothetical protein